MSLIGLSGYCAAAPVANAQANSNTVNRSMRISRSYTCGSEVTA
jgi:hypothetical protein